MFVKNHNICEQNEQQVAALLPAIELASLARNEKIFILFHYLFHYHYTGA